METQWSSKEEWSVRAGYSQKMGDDAMIFRSGVATLTLFSPQGRGRLLEPLLPLQPRACHSSQTPLSIPRDTSHWRKCHNLALSPRPLAALAMLPSGLLLASGISLILHSR
jgi:hypothetical protein